MKTGLLEIRPIFVRKAPRTRAHVLVTMLALKVVREMRRALVAAFGTTEDDKMAVTLEDALLALARLCLLDLPYPRHGGDAFAHPGCSSKGDSRRVGDTLTPCQELAQNVGRHSPGLSVL